MELKRPHVKLTHRRELAFTTERLDHEVVVHTGDRAVVDVAQRVGDDGAEVDPL